MKRTAILVALILSCGVPVAETEPSHRSETSTSASTLLTRQFEITDEAGEQRKGTIVVPAAYEGRVDVTLRNINPMLVDEASSLTYEQRLDMAKAAVSKMNEREPGTYVVAIAFEENNVRFSAALGTHPTGKRGGWFAIAMNTNAHNDIDDSAVYYCNGATANGSLLAGSQSVTVQFWQDATTIPPDRPVNPTILGFGWPPTYSGWHYFWVRQIHTGNNGAMVLSGQLGCY